MRGRSASITVEVDASIFSKESVLAACYVLLGMAHVVLGRERKTGNFLVKLSPIGSEDARKLAAQFNDQLINYSVYYSKAKENADLKKLLIGTALYARKEDV